MVTFEFEDHPDNRKDNPEYLWLIRKRDDEIPFLPGAGEGPQLTGAESYALVIDYVDAEWEAMKLHRQTHKLTAYSR